MIFAPCSRDIHRPFATAVVDGGVHRGELVFQRGESGAELRRGLPPPVVPVPVAIDRRRRHRLVRRSKRLVRRRSKRLGHVLHEFPHEVRRSRPRRRATGHQARGYPRSLDRAQEGLASTRRIRNVASTRRIRNVVAVAPLRSLRRSRQRLRRRHHPRVRGGYQRGVRDRVGPRDRLAKGGEPRPQRPSVLRSEDSANARGVDPRASLRDSQGVERVQVVVGQGRHRAQHEGPRARRHEGREGLSEPRIPRPAHGSRGDGLPGALRGVRAVFGRPSGELVDHPGECQQLPGGASPVAVALDARLVRRTVVQLRQPERPGTHEVAHVALAHHPFRLPHHRQAHKRVRPVRSHSSRRARPRSRRDGRQTVTGTVTGPVRCRRRTHPRQRPVSGRSAAVREDRLGLLRGGHLHGARSKRFKR